MDGWTSKIARRKRLALAAAGAVLLTGLGVANTRDLILYNPSPSVPVGIYMRAPHEIARDAYVTVRAIDVAPTYAGERDFTDDGDRFIKRVAAIAGDRVCASSAGVTVNSTVLLPRQTHDSAGRELPTWMGCDVLDADEVLLLGDTQDSFDGRYWGPTRTALIEGVWRPAAP